MTLNRIMPILPCPSIKDQVAFYENLGFETIYTNNRPHPYAAMGYGEVQIHFYGSKKTLPAANASMCYIHVDDVDHVYEAFTTSYKQHTGTIPRSGIPRISKLKELVDDKRFIVTDIGGNTLFIGTPNAKQAEPAFYRTIEDKTYAGSFEILYDLVYSKEDLQAASHMLAKFFPEDLTSIEVDRLDLAKILLVGHDLHMQRDQGVHEKINGKLLEILNECDLQSPDWSRIQQRYSEITSGE